MTKTVQYQNELHKFLIWDTAGQERFRALAPMYYRGEVLEKDAKDYADSIHAIFVETSAKNAININEVSASPLLNQQEELQEKLSNWDVRPQSLAGRVADDAGDCPYMTYDLTFALAVSPACFSIQPPHTQTPLMPDMGL
ncbi:hypothetical protein F7725_017342 [Dissostichus mawsoni]|uniref:Uncharacterized protein n=1 Tax=Dissostichus mawsoni TaxID=36200 RepID=A0A7J5Z6A1_DISMA|nr:hypothetical protein F7725_017342 [Dissostichus mawsoni]